MNIPFLHKKINLLDNFDKYLFLSPHFDDAVFSCGNLLYFLTSNKRHVKVITFFTKAKKEFPSPQSVEFTKICGYSSPTKLFKDRAIEDIKALSYLNASYKHLKFTDAAWRTNYKKLPIYKNSKVQFNGKISQEDRLLVNQISTYLSKIQKNSRLAVFAPLAIGGHVDHVITRDSAIKRINNLFFWTDFPYLRNKKVKSEFFRKNPKFENVKFNLQTDHAKKTAAIKLYKSQFESIFTTNKVEKTKEEYFILKT